MRRIKKVRVAEGIFLVRFATQYELASTFLRFQEYAESSRFAGRIFSIEEFMDWYASQFGKFSYFEDWTGFNVPSTALEPFFAGRFDPLLEKEKRLLALFKKERKPFYIIGVTESSSRDDLTHELAHALFFKDADYRAAVATTMREYNTQKVERALHHLGYSKSVLKDEVHAYLVAGDGAAAGLTTSDLTALRRKLRTLFRRHGKNLIANIPKRLQAASAKRTRTTSALTFTHHAPQFLHRGFQRS